MEMWEEYITWNKNQNFISASVNIEYKSLELLSNVISCLKECGFKQSSTSHKTGYYDEVEDIRIEVGDNIKNLNMDIVNKYFREMKKK